MQVLQISAPFVKVYVIPKSEICNLQKFLSAKVTTKQYPVEKIKIKIKIYVFKTF